MDQEVVKIAQPYYTWNDYKCAVQAIDAVTFDNLKQYRKEGPLICMYTSVQNLHIQILMGDFMLPH
jgi:hypothetical protein